VDVLCLLRHKSKSYADFSNVNKESLIRNPMLIKFRCNLFLINLAIHADDLFECNLLLSLELISGPFDFITAILCERLLELLYN